MSSVVHLSRFPLAVGGRAAFQRTCSALLGLFLLAAALATLSMAPAQAQSAALGGMDAVSLRDTGRPVGGDPAISTHWKGQEWRFANEANRASFEANPRVYAPAFKGNCPVALSGGQRQPGQPDQFVVINHTLYLTSSPAARRRLNDDPVGVLKKATANWKRLRQ